MTMMTGGEAFVEALSREGVQYVFGVPGTSETLLLDGLEDHPEMKYILGLHEAVAVGVADGYARASGKVGVLNLHTTPGVASAIPYLLNAHAGGTPLLVTAGQADSRLLMEEPALSGDLKGMASHFTKWSTEVIHAADIPVTLQRAFKVAQQPPTGPVFVSLPTDVQAQSLDFEYSPCPPTFSSLRPNQDSVERAAGLLAGAQTPAIVVGARAARNGVVPEVVKLAELTGARVHQEWMSNMVFPTDHPQYLGDMWDFRNEDMGDFNYEALQAVDVLVVIGTQLFKSALRWPPIKLKPSTKVIQVDDDLWEIAKNFPVAAGLGGDIRISLAELSDALQKKMPTEAHQAARARAKEIAVKKQELRQASLKKAQGERDSVPIAVSRLVQELKDCIKPRTVVVDESWSSGTMLRSGLDFTEANSFHRLVGGGTIGWGMPASVGIKLALPDRPVVAVVGDGSAIFSFQSLWIAAHNNLPVTFVVFANAGYRTLRGAKIGMMGEQVRGRFAGLYIDKPRIDFPQLAESMGVWGQKVERPEDLKEILKSALESDKPALVEVVIDDTIPKR